MVSGSSTYTSRIRRPHEQSVAFATQILDTGLGAATPEHLS